MKLITIPKKSGGKRIICVQGPHEKHKYRYIGYKLARFYEKHAPDQNICHGFVEGRSPISNARQHLNKQFSLSLDLKDFFDTVNSDLLFKAGVNNVLANDACYLGTTKQGLSSSPAAANCAALPMDKKILEIIWQKNIVYTRYADDLTFSSDNLQDLLILRDDKLPPLIKECGFSINDKKTRIQSAKFGRRIITGVAVDNDIYPTKKQRKTLRAAKYNVGELVKLLSFLLWTNQLMIFSLLLETNRKMISRFVGLREWCKLKPPAKKAEGKLIRTGVAIETERAFAMMG